MEKWIGLIFVAMFVSLGVSEAVDRYSKGQCRVAAIQRGMAAAEIEQACK
jgi:hypothetical protein